MSELSLTYLDPRSLKPSPWNPNEVDPINQKKLMESIRTEGFVNPVKVRQLADNSLEIVGGEHRTRAAIEMGIKVVPVVNLGVIDDGKAKRVLMLDNQRYGEDDLQKLAELLSSDDIGTAEHLLATMPIDEAELAAYFEHDTMGDIDNDFSDFDIDEDTIDLATPSASSSKDSQILRFKVSLDDADVITKAITQVRHDQGFDSEDQLTNLGDALVYVFSEWRKASE